MGQQRIVRPELFVHEHLFATEVAVGLPLRLAFIGLWSQCDREGRFEWRPPRLKLAILPWDELDFAAVLEALAAAGFIKRYERDGKSFGFIPSWHRYQKPHKQESKSVLPSPSETCDLQESPSEFGDSPTNFAPACNVTVLISTETQYGDQNKDGHGEKQINQLSAEGIARRFLHVYQGTHNVSRIEEVISFFDSMIATVGNAKTVLIAIDEEERDKTQTLLEFANWMTT